MKKIDLSPRQLEALKLTSEGLSRKELADRLCYCEATIKRERRAIVRTLGARNMPHAIALAFRCGILK